MAKQKIKQRNKPIVIPDSIPDELKEAILGSKYPHVARIADPLLVRVDQLSLMVADVVYHARIKLGLGGKGFYIYASGLGTAVYENMFMHDKNDVKFNAEFGVSSGHTDEDILSKIAEKAEDWLDELEVAIASKQSDNPIKKAIDRMCWQLHYDITESHANFPVMFKSDDFSDVKIDRYPIDNVEWWDGYTLKSTISDAAGVVRENDQPSSHTIIEKGYFSDSAQNLKNLDDHLNAGAYSDTEGSMKILDDHFNNSQTGSITKMTSAIGTFDTNNTNKLGSIATKLVPDGNNYYSISECLRDKDGNNTYSIARSLRDGSTSDVSVSRQVKLQMDSLHTDLGSSGSINTSLSTINTSVGNVKSSVDSVNTSIGGVKGDTDTIVTRIGSYSTNNIMGCLTNIMEYTGTAKDRIGTLSDTNTVLGRLYNINGDTTEIKNKV